MNIAYTRCLWVFILCALYSLGASAGEIARDIRIGNGGDYTQQDGGYADIGFGIQANSGPMIKGDEDGDIGLAVNLNMGYQWHGFFVEALSDSEKGLVFGYNALNTPNWSLDVVLGPEHDEITEEEYKDLAPLRDRKFDLTAGVRATGYYGNNILQLQLRNEILTNRHNGHSASLTAGRSWQIRNANLHALVGYHYASQEVVDYYVGVRSEEASSEFPQYTAGATNTFSSELGLTYPINETWILRSKITAIRFDEEFAHSPIMVDKDRDFIFSTITMNYVF